MHLLTTARRSRGSSCGACGGEFLFHVVRASECACHFDVILLACFVVSLSPCSTQQANCTRPRSATRSRRPASGFIVCGFRSSRRVETERGGGDRSGGGQSRIKFVEPALWISWPVGSWNGGLAFWRSFCLYLLGTAQSGCKPVCGCLAPLWFAFACFAVCSQPRDLQGMRFRQGRHLCSGASMHGLLWFPLPCVSVHAGAHVPT